jgi:putative transposase
MKFAFIAKQRSIWPVAWLCEAGGDHGITCSMSRSGNVWDNAAMESFFSSLKTERTARKVYRTRDDARADVFDYVERFYNPKRRHSTLGYLSTNDFETKVGLT